MASWMCNLCGMIFPDDDDYELRKGIHERWHSNCKKEKRNTTEGKVEWSYQCDPVEEPQHEHELMTESDECSSCGCLSLIYEYCHDCGYYELVQDCNCLEDDYGGDDDW